MNFKEWLINEISEKTILYHRSLEVFANGQILEPVSKHKEGHWLKSQYQEKMLEKFREKYAPDKPSRFNCIFCSIVPRSIFLTKGVLYEVKPIGNIHATLAYYINEINNVYENEVPYDYMSKTIGGLSDKQKVDKFKWEYNKERLLELFNKYWNTNIDITTWKDDGLDRPLKPFNSKEYTGDNQTNFAKDPKWIEVLCEKVQVVRKVDENEKTDIFRNGDRVEFIKDTKEEYQGYDISGDKHLPQEEIMKIMKDFNGSKGKYGMTLNIPKGTKGVIVNSVYNQTLPRKFRSRLPYDYTYGNDIYRSLKIKIDGYNFGVYIRPLSDGHPHKIIKKLNS